MADDGNGSGGAPASAGMVRRTRQPLFERELIQAGADILSSLPLSVFRDEQALVDACLYIGKLEYWGLHDALRLALLRLNGSPAIGGRARKESIQAHGNLYWPDDGSKEDKKRLAEMQYKYRRDDDRPEEQRDR